MAQTTNRWYKAVRGAELLKELPSSRCLKFKSGASILREGDRAESCYFITKGKIEIRKQLKDKSQMTVAVLGKNDFFGEMAMLSGKSRSASTVAVTAVEVIEIKKSDFSMLAKKASPLLTRLSMQFAVQLSSRSSKLLDLFAEKAGGVGSRAKKPVDVREVLHKIYSVWAI